MHILTRLMEEDMKPALGVTEPGAIAFAVASAKKHLGSPVEQVVLRLNSGMYKNGFTCGIPGTTQVGSEYAAALGAIAADSEKGLECLEGMSREQEEQALQFVENKKVSIEMSGISSRIFIEAEVTGDNGTCTVTIQDSHMNIVKIVKNGKTVWEAEGAEGQMSGKLDSSMIHRCTLAQILQYIRQVPIEELYFLEKAYEMNLELFEAGLHSDRLVFTPFLLAKNGGQMISENEQKTASLLCGGAIEARVMGLSKPAMSICGSGAHGIIATLPLYAAYKVNGYKKDKFLRATALSYLICMYIKEYSGKLSAFCGCAIAAGTGMACGLAYLREGDAQAVIRTINNMASSVTGMICDGGNQGCTMKGVVAVDAAYQASEMALQGVSVDPVHGINGAIPEETMYNMGQIASPGMEGTEKTIVEILMEKQNS